MNELINPCIQRAYRHPILRHIYTHDDVPCNTRQQWPESNHRPWPWCRKRVRWWVGKYSRTPHPMKSRHRWGRPTWGWVPVWVLDVSPVSTNRICAPKSQKRKRTARTGKISFTWKIFSSRLLAAICIEKNATLKTKRHPVGECVNRIVGVRVQKMLAVTRA